MDIEEKLNEQLNVLHRFEEESSHLVKILFNGKISTLDLFITGILNRLFNLNESFRLLVKNDHYLSAATLVRIQLDTLMRLNSLNLVDDPFDFASKVLDGILINTIKGKDGSLLRDDYLKNKLTEKLPWASNVYKETSGFVHFSDKQIFVNLRSKGERTYEISISSRDDYIPVESKLEATNCMIEINRNVLNVVKGYCDMKRKRTDDL